MEKKKLLIGIIITSLLMTMLPFENMGTIIAKAEVTTVVEVPEQTETSTAYFATVSSVPEFQQALAVYEKDSESYPDGVVITLKGNLDFSLMEATVTIPTGKVYVVLDGNNIYGCRYLAFNSDTEVTSEYMTQFNISGQGSVYAVGEEEIYYIDSITNPEETVPNIEDWELQAPIQLTFSSDVDTSYTRFLMWPGSSMLVGAVDGIKDLSNSADFSYQYVVYNSQEGICKYEVQSDRPCLYIEELGTKHLEQKLVDLEYFVTTKMIEIVDKYVYSAKALSALPDTVMLACQDNTYANPYATNEITEDLIVDDQYGAYTISEDGKVKTYYVVRLNYDGQRYTKVETYNEETGETTTASLGLTLAEIQNMVSEDGMPITSYEKVVFAEGSILEEAKHDDMLLPVDRIFVEYVVDNNFIDFEFQLSNHRSLDIYNQSGSAISIKDTDAEEKTSLWVCCGDIADGAVKDPLRQNVLDISVEEVPTKFDGVNPRQYIEANTTICLTPGTDKTIYDIQYGYYLYSEDTGFEYLGREVDRNMVKYFTNGEVELTVPTYSVNLTASVEKMTEIDSSVISIEGNKIPVMDTADNTTDHYEEAFVVGTNENYQICDADNATDSNSGWSEKGIVVTEEGSKTTKDFYILDSSTGRRYSYSYTYTMDLASPVISKVTGTYQDENGEEKTFENGSWQSTETLAEDEERLWLKYTPIQLMVETTDSEKSTAIRGYAYMQGDEVVDLEWEDVIDNPTANIYTVSKDGYYDLHIYVRDEFDANTGREASGNWAMSFGIDTTAPFVTYTDRNAVQSTSLTPNTEYDGNLYLNVIDEGSGVGSIDLYVKNEAGDWVACPEALSQGTTDDVYYIMPKADTLVYRVIVTDKLGNEEVYDNITVTGYTHDISVKADKATTTYGQELDITVSVTNTGSYTISNLSYASLLEGTDSSFDKVYGEIEDIAAGETAEFTVSIGKDVDAGQYVAQLNINYTVMEGRKETNIQKTYNYQLNVAVEKANGIAVIEMGDSYFGGPLEYHFSSETNRDVEGKVYFRHANESTYTTMEPTEIGEYEIKVVFPETKNYKEATAVANFEITRMKATQDMYQISGATGNNGWYVNDVIISAAEGNSLSFQEDGEYTSALVISEVKDSYSFYVKTTTGIITDAVVVDGIKLDKTAPEIGENEGIYAVEKWWDTFLDVITFGLYEAGTEEFEIKAHDDESNISNISYYISTEAIAKENIETVAKWTNGEKATIRKEDYDKFIIYAKIENGAGMVTYISTDGVEYKVKEPPITPAPVPPTEPADPVPPTESETPEEPTDPVPPTESETPEVPAAPVPPTESETPEEQEPVDEPEDDIIEEIINKIISGILSLKKDTAYQLDAGTWNVTGDSTNYAGGITFYVDEDGEYEFKQK